MIATSQPNHGTASAYVYYKCRCDICKEANRVRAAARRKAQAFGRYQNAFVDAAPVRAHVQSLAQQGWGVRTICEHSGVNRTQVRTLLYGRTPSEQADGHYPKPRHLTKIRRESAEKLLATHFHVDGSPDGALLDATGTKRRIQALAVAGYSLCWQATQTGWELSNYTMILERDKVQYSTFKAVRDLFETHELKKPAPTNRWEAGGVTRAKKQAASLGWLPAAAWDDIDNDPAPVRTTPDEDLIDHIKLDMVIDGIAVEMTNAERRYFADELMRLHYQPNDIDRMLGYATGTTATRVRRRAA